MRAYRCVELMGGVQQYELVVVYDCIEKRAVSRQEDSAARAAFESFIGDMLY